MYWLLDITLPLCLVASPDSGLSGRSLVCSVASPLSDSSLVGTFGSVVNVIIIIIQSDKQMSINQTLHILLIWSELLHGQSFMFFFCNFSQQSLRVASILFAYTGKMVTFISNGSTISGSLQADFC